MVRSKCHLISLFAKISKKYNNPIGYKDILSILFRLNIIDQIKNSSPAYKINENVHFLDPSNGGNCIFCKFRYLIINS